MGISRYEQIEVNKVRTELGLLDYYDMSPKIGLYSLSRVLELILQHLMISYFYADLYTPLDPSINTYF